MPSSLVKVKFAEEITQTKPPQQPKEKDESLEKEAVLFAEGVHGSKPASMEKVFVSPRKVSQVSITCDMLHNFCFSPKFDASAPQAAGPSQPAAVESSLPDISINLGSLGSYFNYSDSNVPIASQKKPSEGSLREKQVKTKEISPRSRLGVLDRQIKNVKKD